LLDQLPALQQLLFRLLGCQVIQSLLSSVEIHQFLCFRVAIDIWKVSCWLFLFLYF
jgi:hypothetical protein